MKKCITITGLILLALMNSGFSQPGIGMHAPEISLGGINGDIKNLSDSKGKIVLVDFWASWCIPCRRSNKELINLYKKYKSNGFEIFGISVDKGQDEWKQAILKDKISWIQVSDTGGWEGPSSKTWAIEQLPTSYLLDKEGIIIAINPTKKEIEKILKKSRP